MEVKRSPPNSSKVKRKQSLKANKHSRWCGLNVITKPAPFDICSASDALSSLFGSHRPVRPSIRPSASLLYFSRKQSHSAQTIIVITELAVPDSTPQSDIQKSGMASFRETLLLQINRNTDIGGGFFPPFLIWNPSFRREH